MSIQMGLARVATLLERLGNPHAALRVVHVAGTNGKGSVCSYVASVLHAAGFRTGCFTSPHLLEPRDSVRIGGVPVAADVFTSAEARVATTNAEHGIGATPFEQLVAVAFSVFHEHSVDYAVIEVGLGGLGDATNVLPPPLVAVVTSIGLDHVEFLGSTVASIAQHKAGIIKPGSVAVLGPQSEPEARRVLVEQAQRTGCPYTEVRPATRASASPTAQAARVSFAGDALDLPQMLPGDFQLENMATAVAALDALVTHHGVPIGRSALVAGFASVRWPGRLEWLSPAQMAAGCSVPRDASQAPLRVLLDGAHNPMAALVLRDYVNGQRPCSVHWIVGFTRGKDVKTILGSLLQTGDTVSAVPFSQPPGMPWIQCEPPARIRDVAAQPGSAVEAAAVVCHDSFGSAWRAVEAQPDPGLVVICGSLYLVADVYRHFGLSL
ncbi:Mur ligase [Entophlyctis helioformis]|nr:Mur ligase [Entophlyctis helioformis]